MNTGANRGPYIYITTLTLETPKADPEFLGIFLIHVWTSCRPLANFVLPRYILAQRSFRRCCRFFGLSWEVRCQEDFQVERSAYRILRFNNNNNTRFCKLRA